MHACMYGVHVEAVCTIFDLCAPPKPFGTCCSLTWTFHGQLRIEVQWNGCNDCSVSYDEFNTLSLPVAGLSSKDHERE